MYENSLLNLGNEVELDAMFWHAVYPPINPLILLKAFLIARVVLNLNETVVSKATSESDVDNLGMFRSPHLVFEISA